MIFLSKFFTVFLFLAFFFICIKTFINISRENNQKEPITFKWIVEKIKKKTQEAENIDNENKNENSTQPALLSEEDLLLKEIQEKSNALKNRIENFDNKKDNDIKHEKHYKIK